MVQSINTLWASVYNDESMDASAIAELRVVPAPALEAASSINKNNDKNKNNNSVNNNVPSNRSKQTLTPVGGPPGENYDFIPPNNQYSLEDSSNAPFRPLTHPLIQLHIHSLGGSVDDNSRVHCKDSGRNHLVAAPVRGHLVVMVTDSGAGRLHILSLPTHPLHLYSPLAYSLTNPCVHPLIHILSLTLNLSRCFPSWPRHGCTNAGISKENQRLLFQEGMQFNPEKLQTGKEKYNTLNFPLP